MDYLNSCYETPSKRFADGVAAKLRGARINNNQFDALVSLAYNIGIGVFQKSTLFKKVMADPDDPTIRAEFAKWVRGGGKILPGLVKRRTAEANHYFGQI